MTMELAHTDDWVPVLSQVAALAVQISGTDLVPKAYRGDPDTVAAIILRGREIGLPPMTALASCFSVNGRVGLYAEAQRALVLAAGHDIWYEDDASSQKVTCCGRRKGSSQVHSVTWTAAQAQWAGLTTGPHRTYPRAMLKARASAELIRDVFPDVTGGFAAVEELTGPSPDDTPQASKAKRSTPVRATPAALDMAAPDWDKPADPEPPTDTSPAVGGSGQASHARISDAQLSLCQILARDLGLDDRDERLQAASTLLGRSIDSFTSMDTAEASTLINAWQAIIEGPFA